jgi:cell wall-associated NlpC family hydrolase
MVDFNSFFNAIAVQESGGNYSAVNGSSGALGKYQIMPANIGPWSQRYMGQRWTPGQFLNDPRKQDALARAVLQDYFNRYGARGAASAWYSGQPQLHNSYRPQAGGYPSIGAYVDQVLAKAARGGGSGTGSAGGSPLSTNINLADKTVKELQNIPAPTEPFGGAGAATSPGAEEVLGAGAEAVAAPGSQAVGAAGVADEQMIMTPTQRQSSTGTQAPEPEVPDYWKGLVGGPGQMSLSAANGRAAAIAAGKKQIGLPYSWGGGGANGPSYGVSQGRGIYGFDCSGLVQYMLAAAGINAPRWSYHQLEMGPRVPLSALRPGDLVGFRDGGHIAFYLGDGEILEAPSTGKNVRQRRLGPNEDAWGVSLANVYN